MTWFNNDGLYIRYGTEESALARGGEIETDDTHEVIFDIDYTDALSATTAIIGASAGSYGIVVPEGARIEALETVVTTAFTSSGTIGSATMVIGLKKDSDLSTELDHDGLTTSSFVAGVLDAAGERVYIVPGVTGAGALIGTTLSESGVLCVANSAHASHPYTAGKVRCRLKYRKL